MYPVDLPFSSPSRHSSSISALTSNSFASSEAPKAVELTRFPTQTAGSTSGSGSALPSVTLLARTDSSGALTQSSGVLFSCLTNQIDVLPKSGGSMDHAFPVDTGWVTASSASLTWPTKSLPSDSRSSSSSAASLTLSPLDGRTALHLDEQPMDLQNIHDWQFNLAQDSEKFEQADQLIAAGEKLPAMSRPEDGFSTKSEWFSYLKRNPADMYIYLRQGADANAQDENGDTLLHHVARIGLVSGTNRASILLELVTNAPGIDFGVKNQHGDTALHVAALNCHDRVTCRFVFPNLIKFARNQGFDFTTQGDRGYTVLHLAALVTHQCWIRGDDKNLSVVLSILRGTDEPGEQRAPISNLKQVLDTLTDSGSSALFYCVKQMKFDDALELLKAGASPTVGVGERTPLANIAQHRTDIEAWSKDVAAGESTMTEETIAEFQTLVADFASQLKPYLDQQKGGGRE